MNEEQLRNRIRSADSSESVELNEAVVARAALGKKRQPLGYRAMRLAVAGGAAVLVAALALPQALTPQPLFSLAGGGASNTSMAATTEEKVSGDAATSMIWPGWIEYNYIADGLSNEPGRGEVYEVKRVGNPQAILRSVAAVFGIEGDIKEDEWSTREYPSYSINSETANLSIYWSGPGGWYFSNWNGGMAFGCAEPAPADDSDASRELEMVCEEPKPSGMVPSEPELIAEAMQLFSQLGIQATESGLRVYRDDWGASVSMPYLLNGEPIALEAYIGWGSDGEVSYASGYSIEIVSRGEFGTVSAAEAVGRITDWRWYGSAPSSYYEDFYRTMESEAIAIDEPMPTDDGGESEPDERRVDPQVEPEIVDLRVTRADAVMLSAWDGQGNMWLVPGYLLFNDQGWFDSIISLEEGVIALPEPYEVMPMDDVQVEPAG